MKRANVKSETVRVSKQGLIQAAAAYEALRAENEALKAQVANLKAALLKKGTEKSADDLKVVKTQSKTTRKASKKPQRKVSKRKAAIRKPRVAILMALPSGERICVAKRSFGKLETLTRFLRNNAAQWTKSTAKKNGMVAGQTVTLRVMPNAVNDSVVEQSITLQ